jgi:hypothetical protein
MREIRTSGSEGGGTPVLPTPIRLAVGPPGLVPMVICGVSFLPQLAAGKLARDEQAGLSSRIGCSSREPQVPPLRFAPVGMTIHF